MIASVSAEPDVTTTLHRSRVLVLGTGGVGLAYYRITAHAGADAVLIDPVVSVVESAVRTIRPNLVVVATPPREALRVARRAAATGAAVLVAHPAALTPSALGSSTDRQNDAHIFVGFEAHFDPAVTDLLLEERPAPHHAEISVHCHRPLRTLQGWRANRETGGGVLHQQAPPALALLSRLLAPHPAPRAIHSVLRPRDGAAVEAGIDASCLIGDTHVDLDVHVDEPEHVLPKVTLTLHSETVMSILSGPSWDAGVGHPACGEHQAWLRARMCAAAAAAHQDRPHPALFPLSSLERVLRIGFELYRHSQRSGPAAAIALVP